MSDNNDDSLSQEVIDEIKKYQSGWEDDEGAFRIAVKLMLEHVNNHTDTFVCLKDDKIRSWWGKIVGRINAKIEKQKTASVIYRQKMEVYDQLTAAERSALGISKPKKPTGYKEEI